jgi:membrane protein implicated in regulation of membrane protease activity
MMPVDPQQVPLSGIPIGLFLMFIGSLLGSVELYNIGFLIFIVSIAFVFVQWLVSGGVAELINWLPIILILSIVLTLSTDLVSQSSDTQTFTWPLVIIVLIVILVFMFSQGGDLSFIVPFLPFIIGIGILGAVAGHLIWDGDVLRGLAYSIGFLGILIMLLWLRVRKSQQVEPVVGEKTSIIGNVGKTISIITPHQEGRVRVSGAIWRAQADVQINDNESIEVIGIAENQLVLKVQPHREL